jgi:perosamine synthetase
MSDRIPLSEPVLAGNEWRYVKEALDTGWVSSAGPFVERFERDIADVVGSRHAVACINGTAALHIALLLAGVGPGDDVLVPTLTFIAPVNAIRYTGAEPVFMDCDDFMNIDAAKVASFLETECKRAAEGVVQRDSGRRVAAILPVHVFGNPCELSPLSETAAGHGIPVVEDATEALGSRFVAGPLAGRRPGSVGLFGTLSFNGNKIITSGGGGMLVTDDDDLAKRARYLTTQAKDDPVRYVHGEVGFNYRLSNVQAALGAAQLEELPGFLAVRHRTHALYEELLAGVPGISVLRSPAYGESNDWLNTLLVDADAYGTDREGLMARLADAGIQSRPVWYPNHLQKPYRSCRTYRLERAVPMWERALNVPSGSSLSAEQVERVCRVVSAS